MLLGSYTSQILFCNILPSVQPLPCRHFVIPTVIAASQVSVLTLVHSLLCAPTSPVAFDSFCCNSLQPLYHSDLHNKRALLYRNTFVLGGGKELKQIR